MTRIRVNPQELAAVRQRLSTVQSVGNNEVANIGQVRSNLDWQVTSQQGIDERLSAVQRRLQNQMELMEQYANFLNTVNDRFTATDRGIRGQAGNLLGKMSQITASLRLAGRIQPRVNLRNGKALATIAAVGGLFGAASISTTLLVWVRGWIERMRGILDGIRGGRGGEETIHNNPNLTQYSGEKTNAFNNQDFSSFMVVGGFDGFYLRQGAYSRFVNSSGRNVGCTAVSEAIVASIYHGEYISPNRMGWSNGGAEWNHSRAIENTRGNALSEQARLNIIAENLKEGRGVVVRASSGHSVAAIGLYQGADLSNLQASDILVLDPADGRVRRLSQVDGYDLVGWRNANSGWSLLVANGRR